MIALLLVATACNMGSIGNLFETQTPTPTNTPTPTDTPTATSTPTPTSTSTPTPTFSPTPTALPTGTAKTTQADGSVLFTDYDNKYTIVFPGAWTAISLSPEDLKTMMVSASESNPDLQKTISMLENLDPKTYRIFAFDFRANHLAGGYASNLNVMVQSNSVINSMTLQNLVDLNTQSIPKILPNATVLSSKVVNTASGIPVGVIETNMPVNTSTGTKVVIYEQINIIKLSKGMVVITFTSPKALQTVLLPEFSGMMDSFRILEQ